jgi:hypothetical protein
MLLGCLMLVVVLFLIPVIAVLVAAEPVAGGLALVLFAAMLAGVWRLARRA